MFNSYCVIRYDLNNTSSKDINPWSLHNIHEIDA